jgi:hypothetical protein
MRPSEPTFHRLGATIALAVAALAALPLAGQTKDCEPVADRAGRALGCFITARIELGRLPRDTALYWYIDALDSLTPLPQPLPARSAIVTSLGRRWRFTIAAAGLPPTMGWRVERVGPLPLVDADSFAAVYMEGVFTPGMETVAHRHPGVEAWYTLEGEQCLESSEGKQVQRGGDPGMMVRGGLAMRLTGTGTGVRRSLVLILQDATKPRNTHATDWAPKGLCHQ